MESTRMQYGQNSTYEDREWLTANMDKIRLANHNYCWVPKYEHFHVLGQTIKRLRYRWEVDPRFYVNCSPTPFWQCYLGMFWNTHFQVSIIWVYFMQYIRIQLLHSTCAQMFHDLLTTQKHKIVQHQASCENSHEESHPFEFEDKH